MMIVSVRSTSFLLLLLGCISSLPPLAKAARVVPCKTNEDCALALREGSECLEDGFCSNPFHNGGCLKTLLPGWNKTRVCNSQDPPEAEAMGFCRPSPLGYKEVRLAGRNWEAANLNAWMLQILLSEILDVPTSIEGGSYGLNLNLYDIDSGFDIGVAGADFYMAELEVAAREHGDCSGVTSDPDNYEPCMHIHEEVYLSWYTPEEKEQFETFMEPARELGAMVEFAWFIPKFAIEKDPTLVSYAGLGGEQNRRKVAETFKTPTRWGQYCEKFSETNCAEPDEFATRPPADEEEAALFFAGEDTFKGYFHYADSSNCDKYPTNCTGHFTDVTCEWNSYAPSQLYHLGIALENVRYTFLEQTEIYRAANATKSAIVYQAYSIDFIVAEFIRTDAEFTRVLLPPPMQDCIDNRTPHICGTTDLQELVGDPVGACDTAQEMVKKGTSLGLRDIAYSSDVPEEFWSPASEAWDNFEITVPLLGQIYELWLQRTTDQWNYDPRDAVCQFVIENIDMVQSWAPETHPRIVQTASSKEGLRVAAFVAGCLALVLVVVAMILTFLKRHTAIFHNQLGFMNLVLTGLFCVSLGAVILEARPSDAACGLSTWLINLGYALHLTPLFLRISQINKLTSSGKGMQHVTITPIVLYGIVGSVLAGVASFLVVWFVLDQPASAFLYELTNAKTETGEFVINGYAYCGSDNDFWVLITFVWMGALLVPACMLAFLSGKVKEDINDTSSLSITLYFHVAVLLAWLASFLVLRDTDMPTFLKVSSLLLSGDTVMTLGIYILPKIIHSGDTFEKEILPDVFVHTTVALMDVQGFVAWSSVREPVQVFQFLEQLYENFDKIAERHHVFKVETVGETFVAATGIPRAQTDHAVVMCKFTKECMRKMPKFVKRMEVKFGPDTGDLTLRIGMNSGPVTGGFLKGKGARFQLFGDTVTTAAVIQANGRSDCIQLSQATAELVTKAGKRRWLTEREEPVHSLEKGAIKTYWLMTAATADHLDSSSPGSNHDLDVSESEADENLESQERWIEWNVEVFKGLLRQIVARRPAAIEPHSISPDIIIKKADMPLEEVKEIVELPAFDRKAAKRQLESEHAQLPDKVVQQLKDYVHEIADLYCDNPFHNFAHASYVVMAVTKYLNRILAATDADLVGDERLRSAGQMALHDHTYGITSDPLTQFACVFAALIHDVDHPGVPNPQLIKENKAVALKYKNRSVAEQKSLDIAWNLLCEQRFSALLSTICQDAQELRRFRQLVVNAIVATDLGDKEMKDLRNGRWEKAFIHKGSERTWETSSTFSSSCDEKTSGAPESRSTRVNRKATIVIEHLIQAADVAHMSQHWNIYRKWNERLFRETYQAYRQGRADNNPADGWYQGEIGFFNFYIIPLSKKLRDCGVFGPTSDENLNYAINNRDMWEQQGQAITDEMYERVKAEYDTKDGLIPEQPIHLESFPETHFGKLDKSFEV